METEYDYTHGVNTAQLLSEISAAGLADPSRVDTVDDTLVKIFYADPLNAADEQTLANVISSHVPDPNFGEATIEQNIATLVAYLNNSNPSIASTARSVIVKNIAPNLPPGLLSQINAQIAALVGS